MAQPAADERLTSLDQLDVVVDADSHMGETIEGLLPYVDERHSWARKMLSEAEHNNVFASAQPTPQFGSRMADRLELYKDPDDDYDLDVKLREMDDLGIDVAILDPGMHLDFNTVNNPQFVRALMSAYNEWLLDQLDAHDRFKANMLVSPKVPHAAAEEIDDRAGERDVVGIEMPSVGITPPPGDSKYDPIYEAAADHGLPIAFHGGVGGTLYGWPSIGKWAETFSEAHAVVHPFSMMWNLTTLILRGVPERFPDLDFVLQESGIAWLPYLTWRLDDHYLENEEEMARLDRLPSEYIRDRVYITTQPLGHTTRNDAHLAGIVEMIGPDSVMYAADIPHPDHDPPGELFDRIHTRFDADTVRGMMGETARELYGL